MGLVTTMGKYCFIKCDGPDCTKKVEHIDPESVKQLVWMCGWKSNGDQWFCPTCTARIDEPSLAGRRRGRSLQRRERPNAAR